MKQRVLVDTSTLVSALLRAGSRPDRALSMALHSCELCVSSETLAELDATLAERKFDRYASMEARKAFVYVIRRNAHEFVVSERDVAGITPRCRDAGDNFLLALAAVADVKTIVSSDKDLLVMHPWRGIPILTPAQFISAMKP